MTNATARKFGYPDTLVAEGEHWLALTRPAQPTLGAMVLVCTEDATAFSDISPAAFAELKAMTGGIEAALGGFCGYQKINYLMLMMVDPDVHFHVLPRYEGERSFAGLTVPDAGWPGPPALGEAVTPDTDALAQLTAELKARWPGRA